MAAVTDRVLPPHQPHTATEVAETIYERLKKRMDADLRQLQGRA